MSCLSMEEESCMKAEGRMAMEWRWTDSRQIAAYRSSCARLFCCLQVGRREGEQRMQRTGTQEGDRRREPRGNEAAWRGFGRGSSTTEVLGYSDT